MRINYLFQKQSVLVIVKQDLIKPIVPEKIRVVVKHISLLGLSIRNKRWKMFYVI